MVRPEITKENYEGMAYFQFLNADGSGFLANRKDVVDKELRNKIYG